MINPIDLPVHTPKKPDGSINIEQLRCIFDSSVNKHLCYGFGHHHADELFAEYLGAVVVRETNAILEWAALVERRRRGTVLSAVDMITRAMDL